MKLHEINSRDSFALFLGIRREKLNNVLYFKKTDSMYTTFEIPKKNGGSRLIKAPIGDLKDIQKKLSEKLVEHHKYFLKSKKINDKISHGFVKEKSIITNAQIHRNKRYILNIDIKNFFDGFHFGRVRGFFSKNKEFNLSIDIATIIAQLTCCNGKLVQGSPTSPIVANLICQILDNRLLKISKRYRLDYTRYVDDLTFSTNDNNFINHKEEFLLELKKEINSFGFDVNEQKLRFLCRDIQQKVTGLVVNKKVNVDRKFYKDTRAMAHSLYTKGNFLIEGNEGSINQLEGRFSFINQVDKDNNVREGKKRYNLNSREREYKKFLFFKYFYYNEKPMIITEGKTDVLYLKAALKSLYKEYPNLITRNSDGSFKFKISFFNRTKRMQYFFDITSNGADTISKLYDKCYNQKKDSYFKYFLEKDFISPKNSVILLYDNEINNKNKPIRKFINSRLSEKEIEVLSSQLYVKLLNDGNVYLLTNPLIDGKMECEIEFLFPKEVRMQKLNGKKLCLKDDFDKEKYYGKNIFANYVNNNFEKINFSNFRPLLNNLSLIISDN